MEFRTSFICGSLFGLNCAPTNGCKCTFFTMIAQYFLICRWFKNSNAPPKADRKTAKKQGSVNVNNEFAFMKKEMHLTRLLEDTHCAFQCLYVSCLFKRKNSTGHL